MFTQIEYPSSVPLQDLEACYKRQNKIIDCIKYLHTANDGIILGGIETNNIGKPKILAGSVCLFCETMFYTDKDIILLDENTNEGMRTISLTYNILDKTLLAKIENSFTGRYREERGDRYYFDEGIIKIYLDFSMFYKNGEYYSKKYLRGEQS